MATAPQVQDINDLVAQYRNALNPAYQQIDQQVAANDASGQAQVAGLGAQKDQAFSDITQASNDRGAFFSGFSPSEQAKYTSSTYLPALAQLQNTIASTRAQLYGKKAELDVTANTNAIDTNRSQTSALQSWQQQQEQMAAQAAENDRQRAFQASQAGLDRSAAASNKAADNAPPSIGQYITSALQTAAQDANWKKNGVTEASVIGNVASSYGISRADASKLVYAQRKQYYGF